LSLAHDVKRGNDAARILAEPVFQDAWKSVEQAIHDKWAESPIRDIEGQQQLRLMLKLLGDVKSVLESVLSDGKVAAAEIERLNSRRVLSPAQWSGR
jgi:hypothetical protein